MATLNQASLNTATTVVNSQTVIQLVSGSGTGWSASSTSLTLTPTSSAAAPAIYVFQINAPSSSYNFKGGTGLNFGTVGSATYGIVTYSQQAYLIAVDDVAAGVSASTGNFALTLTPTGSQTGPGQVASSPLILDPAVSFNPPG